MMKVKRKGSTRMRRATFASGAPLLELRDLKEAIPIVPYYKHLGCMVDPEARPGHESRHRSALAASAYEKAKDLLLQNRDLSLATRSVICQAAVVSTYFNLEVWIAKGKHWEQMSDAFSRLIKRLLCWDVLGADLTLGCRVLEAASPPSSPWRSEARPYYGPCSKMSTSGVRRPEMTYDGWLRATRASGLRRMEQHGPYGGMSSGTSHKESSGAPSAAICKTSGTTRGSGV